MRPVVMRVVGVILERYAESGRVDLNDIEEVIGAEAVTYEDVEMIVERLEQEGLAVGEPMGEEDVDLMREVIETARRVREEKGGTPTVEEIAEGCGRPAYVVRRALERGMGPIIRERIG
jgi:hypothetical protein